MSNDAHSTSSYIKIFYLLTILTVVEISITFLGLPKLILAALLIFFAVWKAALVALHFMHLKFEKKTLTIVALTPFVLCVFLILMLTPDIFPH